MMAKASRDGRLTGAGAGAIGQSGQSSAAIAAAVSRLSMSALAASGGRSPRRQVLTRRHARRRTETLLRGLEESLLPGVLTAPRGLAIASFYLPGEKGLRLGGDFFDLVTLADDSLALVIGDVCGHGPRAAGRGAMLRGAWRGLVDAASPKDIVRTLHRITLANAEAGCSFVTALFAWIDAGGTAVRLISAGHPAPLLLASGTTELALPPQLPLGFVVEAPPWSLTTVPLPGAWTLLFYTDGLIDMRLGVGAGERVGVEGLSARLLATGTPLNDRALAELVAGLAADSGEAPADDIAAVAISKASRL